MKHKRFYPGNLLFLISAFAVLALCMLQNNFMQLYKLAAVGIVLLAIVHPFHPDELRKRVTRNSLLGAGFLSFTLGLTFYRIRSVGRLMQNLSARVGISSNLLSLVTALAGAVVGFYALLIFTTWLFPRLDSPGKPQEPAPQHSSGLLWSLGTAVFIMTLFTRSSPLYPLNDWADANCFLTVGRGMLRGLVPYRDLLEQKGPLLYMLHALAACISDRSFLGVFFLEILCCFAFLQISWKTLCLYRPDSSPLWIPVMATIVYSATSFCLGDSAEELCLPLIAYSIYVFLKSMHTEKPISFSEGVMVGITSGCVLWIKFSLLGIYIGLFPCFVVIRLIERRAGEIFKLVGSILLGIAIISAPILAYFAVHGALTDLWKVYFEMNLFQYTRVEDETGSLGILSNLRNGCAGLFCLSFLPAMFGILGIYGISSNKKEGAMALCMFAGLFFFVFIGGRYYDYYSFILTAFVPLGAACIGSLAKALTAGFSRYLPKPVRIAALFLACFYLLVHGSMNYATILMDKEYYPQYKIAEKINQVENATLLNYGCLDCGFYLTTGIIPTCRSFCRINLPDPALQQLQDDFVDQGKVDFVVTRGEPLESPNYTCIFVTSYGYEMDSIPYYLYQKNPTP